MGSIAWQLSWRHDPLRLLQPRRCGAGLRISYEQQLCLEPAHSPGVPRLQTVLHITMSTCTKQRTLLGASPMARALAVDHRLLRRPGTATTHAPFLPTPLPHASEPPFLVLQGPVAAPVPNGRYDGCSAPLNVNSYLTLIVSACPSPLANWPINHYLAAKHPARC